MRDDELIETRNVHGYFQRSLTDIVDERKLGVAEETVVYVANLLEGFVRSDRFFEWTQQGPTLTPLANLYAEALHSRSRKHQQQMLQRLGDIALFVAGLFAESFNRKTYNIDYYIGMGGAAYGSLSDCFDIHLQSKMRVRVFDELSRFFSDFVHVLTELNDQSEINDDRDLLQCYEEWLRTGSQRTARRLRLAGIDVVHPKNTTRH